MTSKEKRVIPSETTAIQVSMNPESLTNSRPRRSCVTKHVKSISKYYEEDENVRKTNLRQSATTKKRSTFDAPSRFKKKSFVRSANTPESRVSSPVRKTENGKPKRSSKLTRQTERKISAPAKNIPSSDECSSGTEYENETMDGNQLNTEDLADIRSSKNQLITSFRGSKRNLELSFKGFPKPKEAKYDEEVLETVAQLKLNAYVTQIEQIDKVWNTCRAKTHKKLFTSACDFILESLKMKLSSTPDPGMFIVYFVNQRF